MATLTFDRVLADAEALSAEEQTMLEEILHHRRIEAWRAETAVEAENAAGAFRAGKLKFKSASESVIAHLRTGR